MELTIEVKKISVLERPFHTDEIFIHTTFPGTMLGQGKLVLKADIAKRKGVDYCRDVFGIEPEIIKG